MNISSQIRGVLWLKPNECMSSVVLGLEGCRDHESFCSPRVTFKPFVKPLSGLCQDSMSPLSGNMGESDGDIDQHRRKAVRRLPCNPCSERFQKYSSSFSCGLSFAGTKPVNGSSTSRVAVEFNAQV
jgi:hypothetical protein